MSFINKVKDKNNVSYDIHDERVPEILAENEGKILKVQGGELTFADAPAGGTKLYKHVIDVLITGYSDKKFVVITNSSNPIILPGQYQSVFTNIMPVPGGNNESTYCLQTIGYYTNVDFTYFYVKTIQDIGDIIVKEHLSVSRDLITSFTDTVTEL